MKQKYFYHEHLADYAELKAKGLLSRGELYGNPNDFNDFSSKSFLIETLPRLDLKSDARILELGCGTGPVACFLAQLGYQVHGIDVIPDAIDKAKAIAAKHHLDIQYEVLDVCQLPHQGEPYQLIIDSFCSQGIVTDSDRDAMFSGIKARLAENGYFLMSCAATSSQIVQFPTLPSKYYLWLSGQERKKMIQKIEEQDGHMLLYFGEPPADVGKIEFVNCLAHQQNQILFCKWRDNDIWTLPGGRAEPGETAEETAHRELLEETGATLKNLEVLCYIHCFMFNLEYWGIAYLGEIETLGNPLDLEEVSEARLFSHFPENPTHPGPFENQSKALYLAAKRKLLDTKD